MTRNAIQFQPGLSLVDFQARFGRDEQCVQALSRSRWPLGFECPECGGHRGHALTTRPLMQCAVCRHQVSVTAGTIFHSTKLPLRVWFLAMHLLSQAKHSVSGLELSRQLGVSQTTAWSLKHKLMQVMMEREHGRRLHGRIEADDAYMGGERHEGKRGRGAPGKRPFILAVQTTPDGRPGLLQAQAVNNLGSTTMSRWAKKAISPAGTLLTDEWAAYGITQAIGLRHHAQKSPGGWRNSKVPAFKWVNTALGNLKGNIRGVCRWIGNQHLPRYLAEYQWRYKRRFDLASLLPRLLHAAARTPPMPIKLLYLAENAW